MKRILIGLALLAVVLAGGWYWGSPWWTLQSMKNAAEARDTDALSRNVDYTSLRASIKKQLRERMESGVRDAGVLGTLVAGGLADRLVDVALTPEGIRVIFATAPLASEARPGGIRLKANDMTMRREGLSQFRMVRRDGKGGALIFRLKGATWMLSDVELPAETMG
ncbi:MAG: DUF2939 domain-containing protein [Pseudomonadota bacterium]